MNPFVAKGFGDCRRCQDRRDVVLCELQACLRCCTLIHDHGAPPHQTPTAQDENTQPPEPEPLTELTEAEWPWALRFSPDQEILWALMENVTEETP